MCGAPLVGWKCEYCGTSYDPEGAETLMYMKATEDPATDTTTVYANGAPVRTITKKEMLENCCCGPAETKEIISQLARAIKASGVTLNEARQAFQAFGCGKGLK
jgi:hypothetical protein